MVLSFYGDSGKDERDYQVKAATIHKISYVSRRKVLRHCRFNDRIFEGR